MMEEEKQKKQWITPKVEIINSYSIESGSTNGTEGGLFASPKGGTKQGDGVFS